MSPLVVLLLPPAVSVLSSVAMSLQFTDSVELVVVPTSFALK